MVRKRGRQRRWPDFNLDTPEGQDAFLKALMRESWEGRMSERRASSLLSTFTTYLERRQRTELGDKSSMVILNTGQERAVPIVYKTPDELEKEDIARAGNDPEYREREGLNQKGPPLNESSA